MEIVSSKIAFGFAPVIAGQRKASYEPELVALTTAGGFRITPPISKALNLQHGDYIQFIQNVIQAMTTLGSTLFLLKKRDICDVFSTEHL